MAKVGEIIDNGRGERVVWRTTAASSGGELTAMDVYLEPDAPSPPAHIHLQQEERFSVRTGSIALTLGREEQVLTAGQDAVIPAGVPHTWAPVGDEPIHVVAELRPALHFEEIQESIFWLVHTGKMERKSIRNLLQVATVFHHHLDEARTASPPAIVQRVVLTFLAAIGRLVGYTAHPSDRSPHV